MRKFLSLILMLILLAGIITGCIGGKSYTAAPSEANKQNQTEASSTQNAPAESSADIQIQATALTSSPGIMSKYWSL